MGKTKQTRERYQSGSLWEENGKWWLRYSEKHADGKTERPTVCVGTMEQYNTMKKARLAADELMKAINENIAVTRWEHLCDDYLARGVDHLRGYTLKPRISVVNTLKRAFAGERLDHLTTAPGRMKMEAWLNGNRMSSNYRHDLRAIMRLIFRHAQRWDLIKGDNPVDLLDVRSRPQATKAKRPRHTITPDQYAALQDDPELPELSKVVLAVMEYTGLRGCEALGLSWTHGDPQDPGYRACDVEFDSDPPKIWVRRSVKEGHYIDDPKTEESKRTAPLPSKLASILMRWKNSAPIINDWVFGSPFTGSPYLGSGIRKRIKAAARSHGFDYVGFGLHSTRHTFRKAIREAGASPEEQMWGMAIRSSRPLFSTTVLTTAPRNWPRSAPRWSAFWTRRQERHEN
jgi:integrase